MNNLRIMLVWLILLAIPLQGVAASTMIVCGPNHHARAQAGALHSHVAATTPRQQDHDHLAQIRHTDHNQLSEHASAAETPSKPPLKSVTGECSVCASCCNGAAMVSEIDTVQVQDFAVVVLPIEPTSFVDAPQHGLERPPRA